MFSIALVTANFGGIDPIHPLPPHPGISAFYYTDQATLQGTDPRFMREWQVTIPAYPRHDFNPRVRAHYFKQQLHHLDEVREARFLAWADASVQFLDLGFLNDWAQRLSQVAASERLMVIPHQERSTVDEEFDYVAALLATGNPYLVKRYANEKMPEQRAWLKAHGYDLGQPLYCGGVWMVENTGLMRRAFDAWWQQIICFGHMDQVSWSPILARHDIHPQLCTDLPLYQNSSWAIMPHAFKDYARLCEVCGSLISTPQEGWKPT